MFSDYSVQIYGIRFDKTKNRRLNDNLLVIIIYTSKHSVSLASTVSGENRQEINLTACFLRSNMDTQLRRGGWVLFSHFPGKT